MARIYARIAECLERHHIRCMASLIRELARRRRRREQERQLGHPVPAGHHELDEPGIDADILAVYCKFGRWALFESLLITLLHDCGLCSKCTLRWCIQVR